LRQGCNERAKLDAQDFREMIFAAQVTSAQNQPHKTCVRGGNARAKLDAQDFREMIFASQVTSAQSQPHKTCARGGHSVFVAKTEKATTAQGRNLILQF